MKSKLYFIVGLILLSVVACKDDEPELGTAPTAEDAGFTYSTTDGSNNVLQLKADRSDVIAVWDFGNNIKGQGTTVKASYPRKGVYKVSLTVFAKGGSATTSQNISIAEDDLSLLSDPLFTLLTGGVDSINGKTWVIDSANAGHFGVGPNPSGPLGDTPEWWAAPPNDKSGVGLYNDRYTFYLDGFKFDMVTKGDIYVHGDHKDKFPGAFQNKNDYTASFPDQLGKSWALAFEAGKDTTLTVSGNSFIGFNTNVNTYKIVSIKENELIIRQLHDGNDELAWYHRLIPEGHVPDPNSGDPVGLSLPIDFESDEPDFDAFGGSTATIINNPDKRGINGSDKVLETVHGADKDAGVSVDLGGPFDFSSDSTVTLKVWSPRIATIRIRVEDQEDSTAFLQKDVSIPVAFTWIEVSASFKGASSDTYDKLLLYPGWDVASAGTFYLDDIKQE